jgi:hypothetical protein
MQGRPSHPPFEELYSEEETVHRSEAALLRALSTPHKRQAEMKVGKTASSKGQKGRSEVLPKEN